MITINFPENPARRVYNVFDWGFFMPSSENVPFETSLDTGTLFSETRGIYGENDVVHNKVEGNVTYNPASLCIKSSADVQFPQREYAIGPSGQTMNFNNGMAQDGSYATSDAGIGLRACSATWIGSNGNVRVRTVVYYLSKPMELATNMYDWEITSVSEDGTVSYIRRFTGAHVTTVNWAFADFATLVNYVPSGAFTNWRAGSVYRIVMDCDLSSQPILAISQIRSMLSVFAVEALSHRSSLRDRQLHYGDLATQAVEKMDRIQTNMISFLADLRDPSSLVLKLRNLRNLKTYANALLTVKYGILPTVSDLKEIVNAFQATKPYLDKNGFETYSASHVVEDQFADYISGDLRQQIKIAIKNEDRGLLALSEGLNSIGLMPNFSNIWDLVPYSFALDWFVGVGDLLERVDTDMRLSTLDIRYCTMSRKLTMQMDLSKMPNSPFTGTIQWVQYHRWVSDQCPVPPLSLQATNTVSRHWLEAGALIIQRAKH